MNGSDCNPEKPEMKYFNLINNILDVIVELDLGYKITFINPQVYDVFGYTSEEVIGESSLDYIHPDDVSRTVEAIEKGIETREIISIELRIKNIDKNYIPVSAKGYLVEYDDQIKIIAALRDITDIKKAQQNLLESDKNYKEIIENMEDGYFEVDLKGSFTYVNDYICKFLGISKNGLLGRSYEIILEKNTINDVYQNFNYVYENELPKGTFESQVIRNDGTKRIFEGSFYLKYDSSGKKIGFYGFTRDITEKKLVEKTIKESEEKFRTIFNSIPDLFFLVDQDSVILEFSGKQEDLYVPPKEFLRKKMINVLPSDVGKLYKTAIDKVLSSGKPQVAEYHLMIGNKKKYFEARHLLFAKDRIAIFIRNITEKKEVIEQLKQSEEKYREAFNRAELYKDLF
ncbi:MAG: PAS domain S-box protein, partial [Candidatus Thorarchaeota archaeon]